MTAGAPSRVVDFSFHWASINVSTLSASRCDFIFHLEFISFLTVIGIDFTVFIFMCISQTSSIIVDSVFGQTIIIFFRKLSWPFIF